MAGRVRLKLIFTPIFVLLVGFLVSCTAPTTEGPTPADLGTTFVGGTEGVVIGFIPGMPPDQIVDATAGSPDRDSQGNFKIGVQIENVGENDILIGTGDVLKVSIEGINPASFNSDLAHFTKTLPHSLRGKEKVADTVFPGERFRFEFPGEADNEILNYLGLVPGSQRFTIQANACYTYETLAVSKICLTDELFRRATPGYTKVCEGSGVKPVENWGAPVKITRLEQTPLRTASDGRVQSMSVVFDVEQVGPGLIYDESTPIDSCSRIPIGRENIVDIILAKADASFVDMNCFPNEVRLVNGRATVTCDIDLNENLARIDAEDTLVIKLRYGHMVSAQTSLTIHPDRSLLLE